jgi:peptidoglycan hydrolase-like protein with peptidoglycan-binding domain
VKVTKLATPATERRTPIAAEVRTVSTREVVSPDRVEWREVLCETNATTDRVRQIQRALQTKGFNPGNADGRLGRETMAAVARFQSKQGLPTDGYLSIATVEALGVAPR